jgi:hypothetical protein
MCEKTFAANDRVYCSVKCEVAAGEQLTRQEKNYRQLMEQWKRRKWKRVD